MPCLRPHRAKRTKVSHGMRQLGMVLWPFMDNHHSVAHSYVLEQLQGH